MKFSCKAGFVCFGLVLFCFLKATAQQTKNPYFIGVGGGTLIYQGDLVPQDIGGYKRLTPAIQLYGGKWLNPYFQAKLTFVSGSVLANDADYTKPAWKQDRNLRFKTSVNELTARLSFSPFGNNILTPDKKWYPYLFAGAGVSFTHVKRDWSGISANTISNEKTAANLAADSAHKLPSAVLSIPFGAGISYAVSPRLSLFGEAAYHLPVTDYLDGFSYIANNSRKDNFYQISVGISYTFLKSRYTKCPVVK